MTDRRTLVLDEKDAVLLCTGDPTAMRSTVLRLCEIAKARVALAGPDPVDQDTGEVKPRVWRWIFGEANEDVTTKQRGFFHACVLPQIAAQAVVNGERFAADVWKEHLRRMFLPDKFVMRRLPGAKRATPLRVRVSTEDLGIRGYSEHIDRVIAYATTDLGVIFEFDRQEREAVRYRRPTRKPKQQEEATA
jgi:hypothetical protein